MNRFSVKPLHQVTRQLAEVAGGRRPPELVITHARLLEVYTARTLPDREVWIWGGRIAAVKPAGSFRSGSEGTQVYDAQGGLLAPGLVDPHIHVESSMVSVCAYAEAALLNGTTTIMCDSHEIANVCDEAGIVWMIEDARQAPLNVFLTVPSTVPATVPELETAGGEITPEKMARLFDRYPEAIAQGEKMDYIAVAAGDPHAHAILAEALKRDRPVCGHVYGIEYVGPYAAAGVTDTHEAVDREIAVAMLEAGMWVFVRGGPPGTPWNSLPEAIRAVTEVGCDPARVCLCTDDREPDDLLHFGLDYVVRSAIEAGVRPELAWAMASLHPATRYRLDGELGGLGHSRRADLVLLDEAFRVKNTWYGGTLAVEGGKPTAALTEVLERRYAYPQAAYHTVQLPEQPSLVPSAPSGACTVNALKVVMPGILIEHARLRYDGQQPFEAFLAAHELCYVTVIERHGQNGNVAHGLLQGFGLKNGAVASSVGHDAHNLIVAGDNAPDMARAVQTIQERAGGVCVVSGGEVLACVALPIAGLMSDQSIQQVAQQTEALKAAWNRLGCVLPYMGFNLIPLSVIPQLRLTDKGLVKVPELEIVPLFQGVDGQ